MNIKIITHIQSCICFYIVLWKRVLSSFLLFTGIFLSAQLHVENGTKLYVDDNTIFHTGDIEYSEEAKSKPTIVFIKEGTPTKNLSKLTHVTVVVQKKPDTTGKKSITVSSKKNSSKKRSRDKKTKQNLSLTHQSIKFSQGNNTQGFSSFVSNSLVCIISSHYSKKNSPLVSEKVSDLLFSYVEHEKKNYVSNKQIFYHLPFFFVRPPPRYFNS